MTDQASVVETEVKLLAKEAEVAALKVVDKADDLIGTDVAVPVQNEVKAAESELTKIEHEVVAEAVKIYEEVKEGIVAGENLVRKALHINLPAGGGSVIRNPG